MTALRFLLILLWGWIVGVITTLSWIWISEGKGLRQDGGIFIVLLILSTLVSLFLIGSTVVKLVGYTVDGKIE